MMLRLAAVFCCFALVCPDVAGQDLTFVRLAGGPSWGGVPIDGPLASAAFANPRAIVCDGKRIYVADGNTIRRVEDGVVSTLAGMPVFDPALDGRGSTVRFRNLASMVAAGPFLFALDGLSIRRVTQRGAVTTTPLTLPHSENQGFAHLALNASGVFHVSDFYRHVIWKMSIPASVLSGQLDLPGYINGPGPSARYYKPGGIAINPAGTIYVADNAGSALRAISATGEASLLAGQPGLYRQVDGLGFDAKFGGLSALTIGQDGNLYVADGNLNGDGSVYLNDYQWLRRVSPAGQVVTISNRFEAASIVGMCFNDEGTLVAASADGSLLRLSGLAFVVIAGPSPPFTAQPDGSGSAPRFDVVTALALDAALNAYTFDGAPSTLRKISPAGVVTTVRRFSSGRFDNLAVLSDGSFAVTLASAIYRLSADGATFTLIAGDVRTPGAADGLGSAARFSPFLSGMLRDPSGNLLVADSGNHAIRKITPDGTVTTLAGQLGVAGSDDGALAVARFTSPSSLALDENGDLYVVEFGDHLRRIASGTVTTVASGVSGGIATAPEGVYVASGRTIELLSQAGARSVVGGDSSRTGSLEGIGASARFGGAGLIRRDSTGRLVIAAGQSIFAGMQTLPDRAAATPASGPAGTTFRLSAHPQTAASFEWRQIRRPAASKSFLSSTTIANPTLVADVADKYVFELIARTASGASVSTVTLTATDIRPEARFDAPATSYTGRPTEFRDTSTGEPSVWLWDFGDGARSDEPDPRHDFAHVGTYHVTLTVRNSAGSSSTTKDVEVLNAGRRRVVVRR